METLSRVASCSSALTFSLSPAPSPSLSLVTSPTSCRLSSRKHKPLPSPSSSSPCPTVLTRGCFYGSNLCTSGLRSTQKPNRNAAFPSVTCAVPSVTEEDFDTEVLQSTVPVLVDFWASWCGPCRLILPVVEGIQKEYGDKLKVVKIETDPNKNLVEKYKVYGLPALILFENGEVVKGGHMEGAVTKPKLISLLKEKFPSLVTN